MAFPKKTKDSGVRFDQNNVAMLASQALAARRGIRVQLGVRLTLTAPMLLQRWTTKAIVQMLGKMTEHDQPRTAKDLTVDYEASWYRNEDGVPALPCRILKACTVEGAISTGKVVSKAELKRNMRVLGHTSPIHMPKGADKSMDVRIVRNSSGTPDVRARALIPAGSYMDIVLEFSQLLTPDKVVAALEAAGATVGLCDWRPEKGGECGTFEVSHFRSDRKDIDAILKECAVPEEQYVIPPELLRAFGAKADSELSDSAKKVKSLIQHVNGQKRGSKLVAEAG